LPVVSDKEHPSQKANKQKRTVVVVLVVSVPKSPARGAARARGGWGRQWLKPLSEVLPAEARGGGGGGGGGSPAQVAARGGARVMVVGGSVAQTLFRGAARGGAWWW
jgi:hypothetical protein